jgi:hypothetical protein
LVLLRAARKALPQANDEVTRPSSLSDQRVEVGGVVVVASAKIIGSDFRLTARRAAASVEAW